MSSKPVLRIDWATHEAAKYACEKWHYSRCVPAGKLVKVGVWEGGAFIGTVIFGRGTNQHIGSNFDLSQTECVELVRVAMKKHETPVSRIVAIAIRFLKKQSAGLRLVVSYADSAHGHHGGIYQAGNWIYTGTGTTDKRCQSYEKAGRVYQWRSVSADLFKRGHPCTVGSAAALGYVPQGFHPKHRYLMPLDDAMRAKIAPLAKPYPKSTRAKKQDSEPPSELGGAVPTDALQNAAVNPAE